MAPLTCGPYLRRFLLRTIHRGGPLVSPGLVSLGGHAPRRHRMPAARRTTFATSVGMIDRIHCDTAYRRPAPTPAGCARPFPASATNAPNSPPSPIVAPADHRHLAQLAGSKAQCCKVPFTRNELHACAPHWRAIWAPFPGLSSIQCTESSLPESRSTEGSFPVESGAPRPDISSSPAVTPRAARRHTGRSHVRVTAAGQCGRCDSDHIRFCSTLAGIPSFLRLKVDDSIALLVSAAAMARGDPTLVVAPAGADFLGEQRPRTDSPCTAPPSFTATTNRPPG